MNDWLQIIPEKEIFLRVIMHSKFDSSHVDIFLNLTNNTAHTQVVCILQ
jgi:hypothetical protein